mgnify:CR=1 FL=1
MCKCFDYKLKIDAKEHPDQAFPQVLLALIRLERRALDDLTTVEDDCKQVQDMLTVLAKLSLTHTDSDNYASYLFKRAEQLSAHLETYKKIVGKIDIGSEIEDTFGQVSKQFVEYLEKRLNFKAIWMECFSLIENCKYTVQEKLLTLVKLQSIAQENYDAKNYFELGEIKDRCDQELEEVSDIMESCLSSGKSCKEFGSDLKAQLSELELVFQQVVKMSMNRINEMKRTPATSANCEGVDW